ncbi:bifunctional demethylmenaquinone methyltransferase/2-methoxy-6-polyprenyl-1,4-benzoquinol methylase UbiE [Candidatus Sumerlaeota bacterium]|nr:bifunctional demethylmenaquinone methyltransferase/2-methoxy-6-polyprenyl-1,4-benzoquinol methylase UbiE [Candidatus Sumerlaeota bacterium]
MGPTRTGTLAKAAFLPPPHPPLLPLSKPAPPKKPSRNPNEIRRMFSDIAQRYDLLNHLLSANTDVAWRRRTVEAAVTGREAAILDLACGTGDLTLEIARHAAPDVQIVGADFTGPMLRIAQQKDTRTGVGWVEADGMQLPFPDGHFDLLTNAFGLRNMESLEGALHEMRRVLRPGGRMAILEFTRPDSRLLRWFYVPYFQHVLPRLAAMLSRKTAYLYLQSSVMNFPNRRELARTMQRCGFVRVRHCALSFGIAAIHIAERPTS